MTESRSVAFQEVITTSIRSALFHLSLIIPLGRKLFCKTCHQLRRTDHNDLLRYQNRPFANGLSITVAMVTSTLLLRLTLVPRWSSLSFNRLPTGQNAASVVRAHALQQEDPWFLSWSDRLRAGVSMFTLWVRRVSSMFSLTGDCLSCLKSPFLILSVQL